MGLETDIHHRHQKSGNLGKDCVCFDGVGFGSEQRIGREAIGLVEGGWEDWGKLEDALQALRETGAKGGLAGWFDYHGAFRFGIFPEWEFGSVDWICREEKITRLPQFQPSLTKEAWIALVKRIHDYIASGDIYQVNLTQTLSALWEGDPRAFYPIWRAVSPAPYSCYLHLGDTEVLSASPECFLKIAEGKILTQPIKGTRPRERDDRRVIRELTTSSKERAELVMITDLERNDLGQVCEFGSVEVKGLCELATFAHVHHLVSTVEGRLRVGVSAVEAVRACYPGGSITGAPKRRAREIISELETTDRGIYTGAIGYFGCDGTAAFNIAIRTLVIREKAATYGTGAGIVADSDPAKEYEETLHKAAGLMAALEKASAGGRKE